MTNLIALLANMVCAISSPNTVSFAEYTAQLSPEDQTLLLDAGIASYEDAASLSQMYASSVENSITPECRAIPEDDIPDYLSNEYPTYTWRIVERRTTENVTGSIPVEMFSSDFPANDIVVSNTNQNLGCGPVAMIGTLEYFARALGYTNILPSSPEQYDRQDLSSLVIEKVHTTVVPFTEGQRVTKPSDYISAFEEVARELDVANEISAQLHEGAGSWDEIVRTIQEGIPATLANLSINAGSGDYEGHYTNVYGYETWEGIRPPENEYETREDRIITKKFIRSKLNKNIEGEYLVSAAILDLPTINFFSFPLGTHLITYHINEENPVSTLIRADDFAADFINEEGGGQYFFYEKTAVVDLSDDRLYTRRLRCSYIEDQYLVLSPNREDAGLAYLDIKVLHAIEKMTFDAAMWSGREGALWETFYVQGYRNNVWVTFAEIDPSSLPITKDFPENFMVRFGKGVYRIRFVAEHSSPSGDRNKGRVVLDNINLTHFERAAS